MKYFWLFIIFSCFKVIHAQKLSAKVVDENNEPLVGAAVYFDGTTRGVITNTRGLFNIEIPDNLADPRLVITFLGYETIVQSNIQNLKKVYQLKPTADNLDAVLLYDSPFSREDMLKVFIANFLGKGKPARNCEILNLDDVTLYYIVEENTLYATSVNPIIIKNDFLGYRVKFDLKAFEVKFNAKSLDDYYLKSSYYAGFSFFEDIDKRKTNRRNRIYESSLNYFFKALIKGNLDKTRFEVGYKGFITQPDYVFGIKPLDDDLFKVYLKSNVIKYFNEKYIPSKIILKHRSDLSTLKFQKPYCRVDQYGNNIDIENIGLLGDLSKSKVARMLPVNFSKVD